MQSVTPTVSCTQSLSVHFPLLGAKKEGDIFEAKKEEYKVSEERKKDQQEVDAALLSAIKKAPEGQAIKAYLRSNFALSKGQYPHQMVF